MKKQDIIQATKTAEQWKKAKEMGKDTDVLKQKIAKGIYIEDTESK